MKEIRRVKEKKAIRKDHHPEIAFILMITEIISDLILPTPKYMKKFLKRKSLLCILHRLDKLEKSKMFTLSRNLILLKKRMNKSIRIGLKSTMT